MPPDLAASTTALTMIDEMPSTWKSADRLYVIFSIESAGRAECQKPILTVATSEHMKMADPSVSTHGIESAFLTKPVYTSVPTTASRCPIIEESAQIQ